MGLGLNLADIAPSAGIDPDSGPREPHRVRQDVSLTHATFPAGYVSPPHAHESEELSQLRRGRALGLRRRRRVSARRRRLLPDPRPRRALEAEPLDRAPAVALELHNRPRSGVNAAEPPRQHSSVRTASFGAGHARALRADLPRLAGTIADGEASFPAAPAESPLLARSARRLGAGVTAQPLPNYHGSAGTNKSIRVGGETMAILLSERVGLKARPHLHAAEQISYVVEGEVWTFVDDRVSSRRPGDVDPRAGEHRPLGARRAGQEGRDLRGAHAAPGRSGDARCGMNWLVPSHRVPPLAWIPGGFPTDALPAEELEALRGRTDRRRRRESLEARRARAGRGQADRGAPLVRAGGSDEAAMTTMTSIRHLRALRAARRRAARQVSTRQRIRLVERAEELGFYGYHVSEHHNGSLCLAPSPLVFLARSRSGPRGSGSGRWS